MQNNQQTIHSNYVHHPWIIVCVGEASKINLSVTYSGTDDHMHYVVKIPGKVVLLWEDALPSK